MDLEQVRSRLLDVPEPSAFSLTSAGLHVVLTVKPAFSTWLLLWFVAPGAGDGEIGLAYAYDRDLLDAYGRGGRVVPAPLHRDVAVVPHERAEDMARRLGLLFELEDKPHTSTDGLSFSGRVHRPERNDHTFSIGSPEGHAARMLALLIDLALALVPAEWARPALEAARDQLAEVTSSRRG